MSANFFHSRTFLMLILICLAGAPAMSAETGPILVLGDSLTEGYGNRKEESYPFLLEKMIQADPHFAPKNYTVLNGGVNGSTSASALSRLKWYLKVKPSILILVMGANDGLRGLKVEETKKNLSRVIVQAEKNKMKVLLGGMKMPPNYGLAYTHEFETMFSSLAHTYHLRQIPFLLEGVAGKSELNIEDGIHPNAKGHVIIAKTVFRYLEPML